MTNRLALLIATVLIGTVVTTFIGRLPSAEAFSAITSSTPRPTLALSAREAAPGKVVHVSVTRCPRPYRQADQLTWHDSYQLAHPNTTKQPYRLIRPVERTGNSLTGTFVVRRTDHSGVGLVHVICGGSNGNASAFLMITH